MQALAAALSRPDVIDGVLQGAALRLVMAEGKPAPPVAEITQAAKAEIESAAPRFEDAFVAALGGQPKRTLALDAARTRAARRRAAGAGDRPHKAVRRFTAADQISFEIRRGEIFGLLGPNGAGKSTTFKMMCGLLRPTSGNALVDGLDLYKAPAAARARLGYMAQKFSLYGDLSVRQNLTFFAGAYGLKGAARSEAIERAVDGLRSQTSSRRQRRRAAARLQTEARAFRGDPARARRCCFSTSRPRASIR